MWTRTKDAIKPRVRKAWAMSYAKLSKAKSRWQCVRGPISATIATLMEAGWKPVDPTNWIASESSGVSKSNVDSSKAMADFTKSEGLAAYEVLHRFEEDLEADIWKEASGARNGSGLENGAPHFGPAGKAHAKFTKRGEHKKAKAIELIVNNKVWTKHRLLEAGIITEHEANCDRCGEALETDLHRYYDCKANDSINDDAVRKTQYLAKDAKKQKHQNCKWFRAILPGSLI